MDGEGCILFQVEDVVQRAWEREGEVGGRDVAIVGRPESVSPAPQLRHDQRPIELGRYDERTPNLHTIS